MWVHKRVCFHGYCQACHVLVNVVNFPFPFPQPLARMLLYFWCGQMAGIPLNIAPSGHEIWQGLWIWEVRAQLCAQPRPRSCKAWAVCHTAACTFSVTLFLPHSPEHQSSTVAMHSASWLWVSVSGLLVNSQAAESPYLSSRTLLRDCKFWLPLHPSCANSFSSPSQLEPERYMDRWGSPRKPLTFGEELSDSPNSNTMQSPGVFLKARVSATAKDCVYWVYQIKHWEIVMHEK